MINKLLFLFFLLIFVLGGIGFIGVENTNAQAVYSFPSGCTSALGYSVTNGSPCNGTSIATMNIPGCATALGYSITNGTPCSGSSVALQYLAGCTSVYGYSTISSVPCNGTAVAQGTIPTTPGLPTTGAGGNVLLTITLLLSSLAIASISYLYIIRKNNTVN